MKQDEKRPFGYTPMQLQLLSLCSKKPKIIPLKLKQLKQLVKKMKFSTVSNPATQSCLLFPLWQFPSVMKNVASPVIIPEGSGFKIRLKDLEISQITYMNPWAVSGLYN